MYKYYFLLEEWNRDNFLGIDFNKYRDYLNSLGDVSVLEPMLHIYLEDKGLEVTYKKVINEVKNSGRNWRIIEEVAKNTVRVAPSKLEWLLSILRKEHSKSGKVATAIAFDYRTLVNKENMNSVLSEFESWINRL